MKIIQFDIEKPIDVLALDCAIKASGVNKKISVSCSSKTININHEVDLTESEFDAIKSIVESHKNTYSWDSLRRQRQLLLNEADWRIQRAFDEEQDATPLVEYRRALRDITKQESPDTVVWPTKPW